MQFSYPYIYPTMAFVWYILVASVLLQLAYMVFYFARLAWYKPQAGPVPNTTVSVVICAHNEADNLRQYLQTVLDQDYPQFEVVVMDDGSTDGTALVLKELAAKYPQLKVYNTGTQVGKKKALALAVSKASFETLLLTDADCYPSSDKWIANMVSSFTDKKEIVLGYGGYETAPGILNKLIRYETFLTAMQYGSFTLAGRPYMGVGRNLSYKRTVFNNSHALQASAKLLSGDDDLLVNEMANSVNTAINFNEQAFTMSKPKSTWLSWLHQKRRHAEAGHQYKLMDRLLLGGFLLSQILIYFTVSLLLIYGTMIIWVALLLLIRYVAQLIVYGKIMQRLKVRDLLLWLPMLDFMISVFFTSLGLLSVFKVKEWKKDLPLQVEPRKTWN